MMNMQQGINASVSESIRGVRTTRAEISIRNADGSPLARREVSVTMSRHGFLFGTTGFDMKLVNNELDGEERELAVKKTEKLIALFNFVTLPFYWKRFEPVKGEPDTVRIMNTARWYADRGMKLKGHPLAWHTLAPDWLLDMTNDEILESQEARILRDVGAFRGIVDTWDAINEAVIMPVFDKYDNGLTRLCRERGRIKTVKAVFDAARSANPGATLLINDFDVSSAYDILVEGCLEAGIAIDAIGIQSHMHHGYWGREKTLAVLSHFERFGLPIHFTELNILSGSLMPSQYEDLNDFKTDSWPSTPEGEELQARQAIEMYRTLFSHPLVKAITWWDFKDCGWLNAPAGLVRQDMSNKPVYDELMKLVKGEWWTSPLALRTDENGKLAFTGFLGDYEIECEGKKRAFTLDEPGASTIVI